MTKGVYASLEEFKNNNPSIKEFRVLKDTKLDVLYIKDSLGKEYATNDGWGYCDGKKIYIKSFKHYFRLERKGNSFYYYGLRKGNVLGSKLESDIINTTSFPGVPLKKSTATELKANTISKPVAQPSLAGPGTVVALTQAIIENNRKLKIWTYPKPYVLDLDNGNIY